MSVYLKQILAASIAGLLANSAMAADGTINFTGEITAASCSATAGAGTTVGGSKGDQNIDVALGKVSMDSLGGTAGGSIVAGNAISINLDCGATATGLTTVRLQFDPMSGSGVDPKKNTLLKTTGTAKGVGIAVYNSANNLINLAANEFIDAALVKGGTTEAPKYTANLNMRAGYVANGETLVPGTANGTLPFTLTYQ
ncbi:MULTISPECIES: fimbrial protein [Pseudomonas]|uniref:Fimbrial protein n=1 Tax=Pseudomonas chlororaphis TaxID=587753 RepID=A0A0D5XZA5_9PSED|nr:MULTISPECIES: fimbrial protein [Pseudomonas]AJO78669.1 fimbrial protein [Pseudomonas sp. MRSN 12121]AKA24396.1 fimbrial protein [Pseudomonas chlororaphis]